MNFDFMVVFFKFYVYADLLVVDVNSQPLIGRRKRQKNVCFSIQISRQELRVELTYNVFKCVCMSTHVLYSLTERHMSD